MRAKPKTTYVTASPATWELIRAAYLSGLSAPTAAARFGISVGALRKRAQKGGWTKRDQAAQANGASPCTAKPVTSPAPAPSPEAPAVSAARDALYDRAQPPAAHDPAAVARMALNQAVRCLMTGDANAALRHARAAEMIGKLDDKLLWTQAEEDPREVEARLSAFSEFTFQVAGELAGRLLTGGEIPPGHLERAEKWRAEYDARGLFEKTETETEG